MADKNIRKEVKKKKKSDGISRPAASRPVMAQPELVRKKKKTEEI